MRHALLLAAATLALSGTARAHDIWLSPGQGVVHLHYGHPNEPETASADKLMSLTAYAPGGSVTLAAKPGPGGALAIPSGGPSTTRPVPPAAVRPAAPSVRPAPSSRPVPSSSPTVPRPPR